MHRRATSSSITSAESAYDNVLAGVAGAEDIEDAKLFMPMSQQEEKPAPQPSFPKQVLPKKKEEEKPAETDDDEIPACYR